MPRNDESNSFIVEGKTGTNPQTSINVNCCKTDTWKRDSISEDINRKNKGKGREPEWQRALLLKINEHWQEGMEKTYSASVCFISTSGLNLTPPIFSLLQLQVTPTLEEGEGSDEVVLLKATPLLFLRVQIFLCSDCPRLLPHEQHMNVRQCFACQGCDKRYNSSRAWLTLSLFTLPATTAY